MTILRPFVARLIAPAASKVLAPLLTTHLMPAMSLLHHVFLVANESPARRSAHANCRSETTTSCRAQRPIKSRYISWLSQAARNRNPHRQNMQHTTCLMARSSAVSVDCTRVLIFEHFGQIMFSCRVQTVVDERGQWQPHVDAFSALAFRAADQQVQAATDDVTD